MIDYLKDVTRCCFLIGSFFSHSLQILSFCVCKELVLTRATLELIPAFLSSNYRHLLIQHYCFKTSNELLFWCLFMDCIFESWLLFWLYTPCQ